MPGGFPAGSAYDDAVELCPRPGANAAIDYHPGADGLKWYALTETLAHIYVPSTSGMKLSLVSQAPVEAEIPIGITIPEAGAYTISLPCPQTYSDYEAVWLIDHQAGTVTNLLQDSYVLHSAVTGDIDTRLTLSFGGQSPPAPNTVPGDFPAGTTIKLRALGGHLPLSGLQPELSVHVYTANGRRVFSGTVAALSRHTFADGVYIIRTDN